MYVYELPTTGSLSFSDLCIDHSADKAHTHHIPEATQARANLKAQLKESKRTSHAEKDFLTAVKLLNEYLPYIRAIIQSVAHDEIGLKAEPIFSWRTTLSANLFNNSPRLDLPGLHADYSFSLLTLAFSLSNLAYSIVTSVGDYEKDRALSDSDRQAKEARLNEAVSFLCSASGVFSFIGDTVLPEWDTNRVSPPNFSRPPDLTRELCNTLAKLSLADAQTLAIRRLMSKSIYDSHIAPGPPLPASHRPPSLLAKLHIECASLYSSALTLAKTAGESKKEVSADLRRYLDNQAVLHGALSHKWLGVDAGEKGGTEKGGEAVAFMVWAKKELEELKDGTKLASLNSSDKGKEDRWKVTIKDELRSVDAFLKYYKKMNDTVHFQSVPSQADLQNRIPGGRIAISATTYYAPQPAFGPGSLSDARRKVEQLEIAEEAKPPSEGEQPERPVEGMYAGAGSYF